MSEANAPARTHSSRPPPSSRPSHTPGVERGARITLSGEPQPGAMPGTLNIAEGPEPTVYVIDYCETHVIEKKVQSIEEVVPFLIDEIESITWVDVRGIHGRAAFERISEIFAIHPLALEDVVNVPQRPHTDVYPKQQVVIARMVDLLEGSVQTEQLAILFGKGFVLTVQEEPERDCLDPVRERIRRGKGPIRTAGADYLAYALLDSVIDGFYPVLEILGERLDDLELRASEVHRGLSGEIHNVKRQMLELRRAIWPQRDAVNALLRDESPHLTNTTRVYLRDTYDHSVQVMDMVETFREIASGLMDLYLSGVSNRMNEVMKVLTILSSIFLPITFIAGVYGMNFDSESSRYNMPELHAHFGYPLTLLAMAVSILCLLYFYRRKGWLGGD